MTVLHVLFVLVVITTSQVQARDCSAPTPTGVHVPASCTTCYDPITKRCLRYRDVIKDECREEVCDYNQKDRYFVLKSRQTHQPSHVATTQPPRPSSQCEDQDQTWCYMKKKTYQCGYANIRSYCPKACGLCSHSGGSKPYPVPTHPYLTHKPYQPHPVTTHRPYITHKPYQACQDMDAQACYAGRDKCKTHIVNAYKYCRKTCGLCHRPYVTPKPYQPHPVPTYRPYVNPKSHQACQDQAQHCYNVRSQCKDPKVANIYCRKTCGVC